MFEHLRGLFARKRMSDDTFGELAFCDAQWEGSFAVGESTPELLVVADAEGPTESQRAAFKQFQKELVEMHSRAQQAIEREPDLEKGRAWILVTIAVESDGLIEATYSSHGLTFRVRSKNGDLVAVERDFD